jgi:integrase
VSDTIKLTGKLTARKIQSLTHVGFHRDPESIGLYVQVSPKQQGDEYSAKFGVIRSWAFRFTSPLTKKERWMGLGPCDAIGLAKARELALAAREQVILGKDPIEHRREQIESERLAVIREKASTMTFAACVDSYLTENLAKFKNLKHRAQWKTSLAGASASFGELNVAMIDAPTVIKFLTPLWNKTPETASRTRGRIEKVLNWATVHQFRSGENPARWGGNLEEIFSKSVKNGDHHKAMPVKELPAFMAALRQRESISAKALQFAILTAARTNEVTGAVWREIDMEAKTWTVPANRMKAAMEHVVPLSDAAISLLSGLTRGGDSQYVFPGANKGKPLSSMAMLELLRGTAGNGYTVHGFRSTFRDWAGDQTPFDRETIEHALAHKLPDKVEAAYRRSTALKKRRLLMQAWAGYCDGKVEADNVVKMHRA